MIKNFSHVREIKEEKKEAKKLEKEKEESECLGSNYLTKIERKFYLQFTISSQPFLQYVEIRKINLDWEKE